jgi:serine/threonine-protein kinase
MNAERPSGYEQLSPEAAARVDAVCDDFEKAWKAARSGSEFPCVSSYLNDCEEQDRTILAEELQVLDRACRERYVVAVQAGDSEDPHSKNLATTIPADRYVSRRTAVAPGRPIVPGLELVEVIGSGGMGVVFKARQPKLDRDVAVKFLRDAHHADPEQRDRFVQEARAVARLRHPHLVQVYEFGEASAVGGAASQPYLVLEYVSGGSLDDLLRGSPQPPKEAARLVETLANAIHYAHQQGVVHRDLKPANVLLTGNRESAVGSENSGSDTWNSRLQTTESLLPFPKITDFGLAKFSTGANLTQTGDILGTPSYMAPEQTVGKSGIITAAVDVYGLGAILYEALTGRPPFQAETAIATVALVRTEDPIPPRRLQPTVPRDLETICLKCLRKEPNRRYATAADLAEDLRRFRAGEPVRARPVGKGERIVRWCRRKPGVASLLAALALVFLVGTSGVLWQWQRAHRQRDKAHREKERAEHHLEMVCTRVDNLKRLGSDLLLQPGQYRNGKALLEQALGFYQDLLPEDLNDARVRQQAALLFGQLAAIHDTLGQTDEAVKAYDEMTKLLTSLLTEQPTDKDLRIQLADTYRYQGNMLRARGEAGKARKAYQEAAALHTELVNDYPKDASYKVALANTLLNIAALPWPQDQVEELDALCNRMLELYRSTVDAEPDNSRFKLELALGLEQQGLVFSQTQRIPDAERVVREALAIHQGLQAGGRMKGTIERPLARNYAGLARLLAASGKMQEAEKSYKEAVNLLNQSIGVFPESALRRADLAQALVNLANLLKDPDRRQEVEAIRRRVIRHYEKLMSEFPENEHYRYQLAQSYLDLCTLLCALGRQSETDEPYRKAIALESESHALNNQLAWFLATSPEPRLQNPALAVRLAKKAVDARSQDANYWNTLGVAHYRVGDDKAAIAELETATSLRGSNSFDLFFLAMAYQRLGNHNKARKCFDVAVELMEKHSPQNDELRRFRAEAEALVAKARKP